MEDSAEEPQCIAWSTVEIPAGRRMNQQKWSTAGGTAGSRKSCAALDGNLSSRRKL